MARDGALGLELHFTWGFAVFEKEAPSLGLIDANGRAEMRRKRHGECEEYGEALCLPLTMGAIRRKWDLCRSTDGRFRIRLSIHGVICVNGNIV